MTDINDRVFILAETLGIKQNDFADRLNLQTNTLAMIKSRQCNVTDRIVRNIVREFGVNERWLLTGYGDMFKPSFVNIDESD